MEQRPAKKVWLDMDPGHDDAIALLLALHLPEIELLGISTVHGNGSLERTTINAAQLLASFGSREQSSTIPIYAGAALPLIRTVEHAPEIHGESGLGGVHGLVEEFCEKVQNLIRAAYLQPAVLALVEACRKLPGGENDEGRLTIIATGTLTNIALFVSLFPDLVREKIASICLMGGAEGRGNRSPTAEFNIISDPEAASIVLNAEVKVVMMPLNITHTALFTQDHQQNLLRSHANSSHPDGALTPLRYTLSTLLNFFGEMYQNVFGFMSGPPVHDALCVAFVAFPELFTGKRYRVDVELSGTFTAGTTSIDLYDYQKSKLTDMIDPTNRKSWGKLGKNCWVCETVNLPGFWKLFQECVDAADLLSPLNDGGLAK